jgi:hypothetical protein
MAGAPREIEGLSCEEVIVVENLEVRVQMHASRTSAAARFVDGAARERRVSLIARPGGGALTTSVPERYEQAMHTLGYRLWPRVESDPPQSGVRISAMAPHPR